MSQDNQKFTIEARPVALGEDERVQRLTAAYDPLMAEKAREARKISSTRYAERLRYAVGMVLERKQDEREGVLHVESRDFDASSLTIEQAENGAGWKCMGDGREIEKIRVGRVMVELISSHGEGLTAKELAAVSGRSQSALYTQLATAEKHGVVYQLKEEKDGSKKQVAIWYLGPGI